MLIRALIVLLAILNLGVAVWWIARPDPPPLPAQVFPEGVPELQLAIDATPAIGSEVQAPALAEDAAVEATAVGSAGQCFSLGPLGDRVAAENLVAALGARALITRTREASVSGADSYRVRIPPSASREEAQALARRIAEAGFDDYLLVATGVDANSIALGLYRSREGAERRLEALRAAGFAAQLQPMDAGAQWWLDVMVSDGFDAAQAQALSGVPGVVSLDCGDLR